MTDATTSDWTRGGDRLVVQRCPGCEGTWYFARSFCPRCGRRDPVSMPSAGLGTVHATTLVHRAPGDEFRALAPYRIVLVDLDEGVRVMGHATADAAIGDRVSGTVRTLAGRPLPFFDRLSTP